MPKTMLLKAKPGLKVPYPENSYRYLEGDEAAAVDVDTWERLEYWHRRVEAGEAEELTGDAVKTHAAKAKARAEKTAAEEHKAIEDSEATRKIIASAPTPMIVQRIDGTKGEA